MTLAGVVGVIVALAVVNQFSFSFKPGCGPDFTDPPRAAYRGLYLAGVQGLLAVTAVCQLASFGYCLSRVRRRRRFLLWGVPLNLGLLLLDAAAAFLAGWSVEPFCIPF